MIQIEDIDYLLLDFYSGMALNSHETNDLVLLNDATFLYYFPVYLYSGYSQFLTNWIKA
jgi:hypothetical protein